MANINLNDRVAVVTGAGGGLGEAYSLELASRGAKVVVNDLGTAADGRGADKTSAQKVVDRIRKNGGEAVASYDSVTDQSGAQKIVKTALDTYGRVDILVNNAGILRDKSFLKMDPEDFLQVVKVHLEGTFYVTRAVFPYMKNQGYGRIISASSAAGLYGNFGQSNYGAAKMGIVGLMNCLSQEGSRYGIFTNTVVPVAGTRMTASVMPPEAAEKVKPEYVAPLVAYLCSEQCRENGKIFTAGGGYFSRVAVMEGLGHYFNPEQEIKAEMIAENLERIDNLQGAREFQSAVEQTTQVLSRIMQT